MNPMVSIAYNLMILSGHDFVDQLFFMNGCVTTQLVVWNAQIIYD